MHVDSAEEAAAAIYFAGSLRIVEAMAREGIPLSGHVGYVPRWATWTGVRSVGESLDTAKLDWELCEAHEDAGASAVEIEVMPSTITAAIAEDSSLFLISIGAGPAGQAQYLFAEDVLGHKRNRLPRHAKVYADFHAEFVRIQELRVQTVRRFAEDSWSGAFPSSEYSVDATEDMDSGYRSWLLNPRK